jgi:hypothetical protein
MNILYILLKNYYFNTFDHTVYMSADQTYIVAQGLSGQTLQVPNEQTMNDVRGSRLVLLKGIDNAIQRLVDSEPGTSIQKPTGEFDIAHIIQLLKTDQLGAAIEELTNLEAKVIKVFGEEAANKEVVPEIENLIGALQKQEFSPPSSSSPPSAVLLS